MIRIVELVSLAQNARGILYVRLHAHGRHRERGHLLRPGAHIRSHEPHPGRPECRDRVHVSGLWMGLSVLAAAGAAVWKAAGVFDQYFGDDGDSGLGAVYDEQWAVDCE